MHDMAWSRELLYAHAHTKLYYLYFAYTTCKYRMQESSSQRLNLIPPHLTTKCMSEHVIYETDLCLHKTKTYFTMRPLAQFYFEISFYSSIQYNLHICIIIVSNIDKLRNSFNILYRCQYLLRQSQNMLLRFCNSWPKS